ncbi:proteasome regulatory particle base subunit [Perkinsus chesapeaki]|uniref:Proteasome regulatory particle base subunit n=1 Tax=Perkinsus chesapeaki TaxID=330153 RepID=A0A7J6LP45_PERCH|nr:proteasome regulatory particle base subunit [Perkinsus chesapeaki]
MSSSSILPVSPSATTTDSGPDACISSAAGVLCVLDEPVPELQTAALKQLLTMVDDYWTEIADYLPQIESLYEDESFPDRHLAALLASKVFFNLEEYDEALRYALGAGKLLDITARGSDEYTDTIVSKAIDAYVRHRNKGDEDVTVGDKEGEEFDPRIEELVKALLKDALMAGDLKQGLGVALEAERLDWVEKFITDKESQVAEMLLYCKTSALELVDDRQFRGQVLELLIKIYKTVPAGRDRDWAGLAQCYFLLNRPEEVAAMLRELLDNHDKFGRLMAMQIAFDLADSEAQQFCQTVSACDKLKVVEQPTGEASTEEDVKVEENQETDKKAECIANIKKILAGDAQTDLNLEFLYRNSATDLLLLDAIKANQPDERNSITHNAIVLCHALMQCGTTSDTFLRANLEWLGKAVYWAKFTATGSLGVIHKGHLRESKSILSTYLPAAGGSSSGAAAGGSGSQSPSPYSEGGGLYALGLIHANHHTQEIVSYLREMLQQFSGSEVHQVGACLGLGLTAMGSADPVVYEDLKNTLFQDSAVSGEAAGYGMGLVMTGSGDETAINDLLSYAKDTSHEKIIRACGMALALIQFRREQEAEPIIEQMANDQDAILRYGAMFMTGLAYCGTSRSSAIRRLLHFSVSDVSDDVRRAAVISLGFVLCNSPQRLPAVLRLLSESYNPHVRYAVCLAIGFACAGQADSNPDAVKLLEPLLKDRTDFVRQGAVIGMGFLCMQTSAAQANGVATKFRAELMKIATDRHQDVSVRFGAIVAFGIMDCGGRNETASFFSKAGTLRMGAAVGFVLFAQMYWYPLILCLSLSFSPTALIGLNEDMKMPKMFAVQSLAKPSQFAYSPPTQPMAKADTKKSTTSVKLSTTNKAGKKSGTVVTSKQAKPKQTPAKTPADAASVTATAGGSVDQASEGSGPTPMDVDKKPEEEEATTRKTTTPEPTEQTLYNPSRVVPAQESSIRFYQAGEMMPPRGARKEQQKVRYLPVLSDGSRRSGFLMLDDLFPEEPEEILTFADQTGEDKKSEEGGRGAKTTKEEKTSTETESAEAKQDKKPDDADSGSKPSSGEAKPPASFDLPDTF